MRSDLPAEPSGHFNRLLKSTRLIDLFKLQPEYRLKDPDYFLYEYSENGKKNLDSI